MPTRDTFVTPDYIDILNENISGDLYVFVCHIANNEYSSTADLSPYNTITYRGITIIHFKHIIVHFGETVFCETASRTIESICICCITQKFHIIIMIVGGENAH